MCLEFPFALQNNLNSFFELSLGNQRSLRHEVMTPDSRSLDDRGAWFFSFSGGVIRLIRQLFLAFF